MITDASSAPTGNLEGMEILFFTELYYLGGLYRVITQLLENWPKNDRLVFMCNENMPGLQEIKNRFQGDCQIVTYSKGIQRDQEDRGARGIIKRIRIGLRIISHYFLLAYHVFYFRNKIGQYAPERIMIINGGYPGGDACRAAALGGLFMSGANKPIMNFHAVPVRPKWIFAIPEYFIDYLIAGSVSCFVTVSESAVRQLANRPGLFNSKKKKRVIYNGTEIGLDNGEGSEENDIRRELRIPIETLLILMLATYEGRKGHEFLLKAFVQVKMKIPQAHLVIAGDGSTGEISKVKKMIETYGLSPVVHLLEFRMDVLGLLRQSQVVVLPSQQSEGFGMTIIEAMAHRIPVVATSVGGVPEVLENGKGGYVVPLDPDLFAEKIIALLKDPLLRRSVGSAGYAVVQDRYTLKRMVKDYFSLTRHPL